MYSNKRSLYLSEHVKPNLTLRWLGVAHFGDFGEKSWNRELQLLDLDLYEENHLYACACDQKGMQRMYSMLMEHNTFSRKSLSLQSSHCFEVAARAESFMSTSW